MDYNDPLIVDSSNSLTNEISLECKFEANPKVIVRLRCNCLDSELQCFAFKTFQEAFNIFKSQCNNKESEKIVRCEVQRKNELRNLQWAWMQWGSIAYF